MLTGETRPTSATSAALGKSAKPAKRATPAACRCHPAGQQPLSLLRVIREDLDAVLVRDPSRTSRAEALLHAPWQGLALYRVAHRLWERGHRIGPALLTWAGRIIAGTELHPGARLGRRAFIDHGFGVVVGESCVIGDDVSLYHNVTLGSRGWWQDDPPRVRRHPALGDRVRVGTGASVLGSVTIGDDVQVRAHALVLHDVPGSERERGDGR
jgi:serine O-acetyltransferase